MSLWNLSTDSQCHKEINIDQRTNPTAMKRRDFIISSAMLGGGLMLSFHTTAMHGSTRAAMFEDATALGDFVKIMPNGEVVFQFVKHEMGQGISTAMAQIFSEELCADWEKVKIEFLPADLKRYQNDANGGHDTGGSCTIIYQWDLL